MKGGRRGSRTPLPSFEATSQGSWFEGHKEKGPLSKNGRCPIKRHVAGALEPSNVGERGTIPFQGLAPCTCMRVFPS